MKLKPFWCAVIVNRLPEQFTDGVVLANDFDEGTEFQAEDIQYALLARSVSQSETQAIAQALEATQQYEPSAAIAIADDPRTVIREERRLASALQEGDVSLRSSFVGFKRSSELAQTAALRVVQLAIGRRPWEFWK